MSAAVQDVAAAVEQARTRLAHAERALDELERDHDGVAAELERIDALDEIDQKGLLLKENSIRQRRRLAAEIVAARATVDEARTALADAERSRAAAQAQALAEQLVADAEALRLYVTAFLAALDDRVSDLRTRDAEAVRLASEGGIALDRSWTRWIDAPDAATLIHIPAEIQQKTLADELRAAQQKARAEADRRERERRAELSVEERRAEAWRAQWSHVSSPPAMPASFRAPDEILADHARAAGLN